MASPLFNFSGLASGLDTNSIVASLMQVERAPITRLQINRAEYDQKLDAWTSITSKVSEFRTALDELNSTTSFDKFVGVTSSDEDVIGVTMTGTPKPATVSMNVIQTAATHQIATGSGFTASDDLVGAGTFTITTGSGPTNITTDASTTLLQLAQDINGADIDVNASIIQVTDTDHRLLLTAANSGLADQFTVSSDLTGFAGFARLAGIEVRRFNGELAPVQKRIGDGVVARGQPGVGHHRPGKTVGIGRQQAQPDQTAPVLADQGDALQIHLIQPGLHPAHVPLIGVVILLTFGPAKSGHAYQH